MNKQDCLNLFQALQQVGTLTGQRFSYCVARNLSILKPEVKQFEESRQALLVSHSKKDKDGKPIILETKDKDGNITDSKYDIADQEKLEKDFQELTQEETEKDIKLFMVDIAEVPQAITVQQMNGILPIILSTEQPIKKGKK